MIFTRGKQRPNVGPGGNQVTRKQRARALSAVLATMGLLALALAACGTDSESGSSESDGGPRVSMLNSGSRTDSSWTQSWFDGSQAAQREVSDATIGYVDQLNSVDALERAGGAALSDGANAVIYATSEVPQALDKLGEQFPDAFVCGVEGPRSEYLDNVCTIYPHFQDGAFLAGVTAGLTTDTDHVGVVAAFDGPIQNIQVEAFALGARYVNPGVEVERAYTQSLIDPGKARAAADAQYSAGADVVLSAVDDAIRGIYSAARERDGLVIAQYVDQYEDAPDVVLTSVLYHLDEIARRMLLEAAGDGLRPKSYEFSLSNGPFGEPAPFRGATGRRVDDAARKRLDQILRDLRSGNMDLPGIEVLGRAGSSDKIDPETLGGSA